MGVIIIVETNELPPELLNDEALRVWNILALENMCQMVSVSDVRQWSRKLPGMGLVDICVDDAIFF